MGILKSLIVILTIVFLLAAGMPAGVSARMEARWALQSGDVLIGTDLSVQHPQATLYHNTATTLTDSESAGISFPTSIVLSPSQGTDLALPAISQISDQTAETSDTGFFRANWCFLNTPNNGGGPLDASDATSTHPYGSSRMIGSDVIFPYMTPIADAKMNFKPIINSSDMTAAIPDMNDQSTTPVKISTAAFLPTNTSANVSSNQTGNQSVNQTGPSMQQGVRKPRINPASTAAEIKNMTDLQRMDRNAFVGTTMYKAYQGNVSSPTWISPNENPADVTKMKDHLQTNKDALNMTKDGSKLIPVFWDL
jgi:hypothetical protein